MSDIFCYSSVNPLPTANFLYLLVVGVFIFIDRSLLHSSPVFLLEISWWYAIRTPFRRGNLFGGVRRTLPYYKGCSTLWIGPIILEFLLYFHWTQCWPLVTTILLIAQSVKALFIVFCIFLSYETFFIILSAGFTNNTQCKRWHYDRDQSQGFLAASAFRLSHIIVTFLHRYSCIIDCIKCSVHFSYE